MEHPRVVHQFEGRGYSHRIVGSYGPGIVLEYCCSVDAKGSASWLPHDGLSQLELALVAEIVALKRQLAG